MNEHLLSARYFREEVLHLAYIPDWMVYDEMWPYETFMYITLELLEETRSTLRWLEWANTILGANDDEVPKEYFNWFLAGKNGPLG